MAQQHKDAYYFPHDSNARNDPKVLKLRKDHGITGYGIYFCLIEMLRESNAYRLLADYETIAYDLRVEAGTVKSVVEDFGLFSLNKNGEGREFFSRSLLDRMERVNALRLKRIEAGRKGGKQRSSNAKAELKQVQAQKESKSKESKSKKEHIPFADGERSAQALFAEIWLRFPNKDSKQLSYQRFLKTVRTEQDWHDINACLDNYLRHLTNNPWKQCQSGKTWFGNWTDRSWLEFEEPRTQEEKDADKRSDLLED